MNHSSFSIFGNIYYCHLIDCNNNCINSLEYASLAELLEDWPTAQNDPKFSQLQYEVYV